MSALEDDKSIILKPQLKKQFGLNIPPEIYAIQQNIKNDIFYSSSIPQSQSQHSQHSQHSQSHRNKVEQALVSAAITPHIFNLSKTTKAKFSMPLDLQKDDLRYIHKMGFLSKDQGDKIRLVGTKYGVTLYLRNGQKYNLPDHILGESARHWCDKNICVVMEGELVVMESSVDLLGAGVAAAGTEAATVATGADVEEGLEGLKSKAEPEPDIGHQADQNADQQADEIDEIDDIDKIHNNVDSDITLRKRSTKKRKSRNDNDTMASGESESDNNNQNNVELELVDSSVVYSKKRRISDKSDITLDDSDETLDILTSLQSKNHQNNNSGMSVAMDVDTNPALENAENTQSTERLDATESLEALEAPDALDALDVPNALDALDATDALEVSDADVVETQETMKHLGTSVTAQTEQTLQTKAEIPRNNYQYEGNLHEARKFASYLCADTASAFESLYNSPESNSNSNSNSNANCNCHSNLDDVPSDVLPSPPRLILRVCDLIAFGGISFSMCEYEDRLKLATDVVRRWAPYWTDKSFLSVKTFYRSSNIETLILGQLSVLPNKQHIYYLQPQELPYEMTSPEATQQEQEHGQGQQEEQQGQQEQHEIKTQMQNNKHNHDHDYKHKHKHKHLKYLKYFIKIDGIMLADMNGSYVHGLIKRAKFHSTSDLLIKLEPLLCSTSTSTVGTGTVSIPDNPTNFAYLLTCWAKFPDLLPYTPNSRESKNSRQLSQTKKEHSILLPLPRQQRPCVFGYAVCDPHVPQQNNMISNRLDNSSCPVFTFGSIPFQAAVSAQITSSLPQCPVHAIVATGNSVPVLVECVFDMKHVRWQIIKVLPTDVSSAQVDNISSYYSVFSFLLSLLAVSNSSNSKNGDVTYGGGAGATSSSTSTTSITTTSSTSSTSTTSITTTSSTSSTSNDNSTQHSTTSKIHNHCLPKIFIFQACGVSPDGLVTLAYGIPWFSSSMLLNTSNMNPSSNNNPDNNSDTSYFNNNNNNNNNSTNGNRKQINNNHNNHNNHNTHNTHNNSKIINNNNLQVAGLCYDNFLLSVRKGLEKKQNKICEVSWHKKSTDGIDTPCISLELVRGDKLEPNFHTVVLWSIMSALSNISLQDIIVHAKNHTFFTDTEQVVQTDVNSELIQKQIRRKKKVTIATLLTGASLTVTKSDKKPKAKATKAAKAAKDTSKKPKTGKTDKTNITNRRNSDQSYEKENDQDVKNPKGKRKSKVNNYDSDNKKNKIKFGFVEISEMPAMSDMSDMSDISARKMVNQRKVIQTMPTMPTKTINKKPTDKNRHSNSPRYSWSLKML